MIPPMVNGFIGLCRGMVSIRSPLVITMCFLGEESEIRPSPGPSPLADERRQEISPLACGHFHFAHILSLRTLTYSVQIFGNRRTDVLQSFLFRRTRDQQPGRPGQD